MPRITPINWKKFEKFLMKMGCEFKREKGDHRIYWKKGMNRPIVIPKDSQLPVFIIRNNIRLLDVSQSEYLKKINKL